MHDEPHCWPNAAAKPPVPPARTLKLDHQDGGPGQLQPSVRPPSSEFPCGRALAATRLSSVPHSSSKSAFEGSSVSSMGTLPCLWRTRRVRVQLAGGGRV